MQIFITGWWLCPELYLRRPFQHHGSSRLDGLLEARAKQGVQVPSLLLYFYDFHQKLSRIWYMKGRRAWNYEATFATCSVIYLLLHMLTARDENGSDTNGYHSYYICFHIDLDSDTNTDSVRIHIRIRIDSVTDTNNEYRIRYESNSKKVGYKYLFGYWVKAAYIYISYVRKPLHHSMSP